MKKLTKTLFVALGFVALILGTVGIIVPLLPTTPLYLFAAFCFAKGSTRFHTWFTQTKLYQKHLEKFINTRAMTLKTKLTICMPVSLMLAVAFVLAPIWHAKVLIALVLLFKWWYFIFRVKTTPATHYSSKGESKKREYAKGERKRV